MPVSNSMLTIAQVAKTLRKRRSTVEKWCDAGDIRCCTMPDTSRRISQEALDDFLAGCEARSQLMTVGGMTTVCGSSIE